MPYATPTPGSADTHPVDLYVGRRIRARRMQLGVSQEVLAKGLGVSFQQIQKYEKGVNRVSCSMLVEIAKVLKAPPAYFFEGAPGTTLAGDKSLGARDLVTTFMATWGGVDLASAFMRLPQHVRKPLVNLVTEMASPSHSVAAE